jgi:nitroreductase
MESQERPLVQESALEMIRDLALYPKSAVGFDERTIPSDTLQSILEVITPYASVSDWRVIAVQERARRIRLLESMQAGYRSQEKPPWARAMDRWKPAPVILVFCMPKTVGDFGGVPSAIMRPLALIELGCGVQSLVLAARAYGIETHWIASALLVEDHIRQELGIADDYDVVFFGVAGYPAEQVDQELGRLEKLCYESSWGIPYRP